ncbi:MAG TPA: hypothetical protein VKU87_11365 [Thermomicrobiaceae bacterium]|nr:hypothetical protein [Thermomicrobiaceae bacterium]
MEGDSLRLLKAEIARRLEADRRLLDQLREEIRPLAGDVHRIQPRTTTSISLVGTDGGNNQLHFDPFLVQLVRVVDSSDNEYCLQVVTPRTNLRELSAQQFGDEGPATPLGALMRYLDFEQLSELSPMLRANRRGEARNANWVKTYRELMEWAVLFELVRERSYGTDTLILYDGLLRSNVFDGDLFRRYLDGLREGIERLARKSRRKLYLAGIAKQSKVLTRYRLAMALEGVLTTGFPAYVPIPREIEERAYQHIAYARGDDRVLHEGGVNRFVGGKMFFVKLGNQPSDPVWPVDIFEPQAANAQLILGCVLADAANGFPIPYYPRCLQIAHEHAALVEFDAEVLQDQVFDGLRGILGDESDALDRFRLQDGNPAELRYNRELQRRRASRPSMSRLAND